MVDVLLSFKLDILRKEDFHDEFRKQLDFTTKCNNPYFVVYVIQWHFNAAYSQYIFEAFLHNFDKVGEVS